MKHHGLIGARTCASGCHGARRLWWHATGEAFRHGSGHDLDLDERKPSDAPELRRIDSSSTTSRSAAMVAAAASSSPSARQGPSSRPPTELRGRASLRTHPLASTG